MMNSRLQRDRNVSIEEEPERLVNNVAHAKRGYRMRLNHQTESKAVTSPITAAAAEKRAVISVSRFSNTSRLLRVL